jgi:hypothetical protein
VYNNLVTFQKKESCRIFWLKIKVADCSSFAGFESRERSLKWDWDIYRGYGQHLTYYTTPTTDWAYFSHI